MKPKLDMGVEVNDNKVKKKQRHATNEKPNMYINVLFFKRNFPSVLVPSQQAALQQVSLMKRELIDLRSHVALKQQDLDLDETELYSEVRMYPLIYSISSLIQ